MFEYFKGILTQIAPTYVVIEVGQVGYKVLTPNPFRMQKFLNHECTLYIEQVIREDAHTLYGFSDASEKELFQTLNKVSGIGPKSALSILAADDHQGLVRAIEAGDSQYLTKFPGVGKKTAQQIVLDLKGKLSEWLGEEAKITSVEGETRKLETLQLEEVYEALTGLGYSAREIKRIEKPLEQAQCQSTQEALSLAFKLLLNK